MPVGRETQLTPDPLVIQDALRSPGQPEGSAFLKHGVASAHKRLVRRRKIPVIHITAVYATQS